MHFLSAQQQTTTILNHLHNTTTTNITKLPARRKHLRTRNVINKTKK